MGIVKFSIWFDIPSKYIEDFCHCFCYCGGYIFRKSNWHILPGFFPLVFVISPAVVKTDAKNVLLNSLFFHNWPAFFLFVSYLPAKC